MEEDWITIRDASKASGFHSESIRKLLRDKRVEGRKFATVWQISRSSLEEYLKMQAKTRGKKRGRPKS